MKKLILGLFIIIVVAAGIIVAVVKTDNSLPNIVKNNMAEITENYYLCENQAFSLSLSVGSREEPYLMDGVKQKSVDFSLIILNSKQKLEQDEVLCKIITNGKENEIKLQYNPVADRYMYDLGYKLSKNDEIFFEFNSNKEKLNLVSDSFVISSQQALKLACQHYEDTLQKYVSGGKLQGECYLKIMKGQNSDKLFWTFTFIGQNGENINLIIDTQNGKIIAND